MLMHTTNGTTHTATGLSEIIARLLRQAHELYQRGDDASGEARGIRHFAGLAGVSDFRIADPLLDGHTGGEADRDSANTFRVAAYNRACSLDALATVCWAEADRLTQMVGQLADPARLVAPPASGKVPPMPSRLAAEAAAWEANEKDEEEVASVEPTDADPCPLPAGFEDMGTVEITPPGGVMVCGPIFPRPGWAEGRPLVYECRICRREPVADSQGMLRCPDCNPEPGIGADGYATDGQANGDGPEAVIVENAQVAVITADTQTTTAANGPALEAPPAPLAPASEELAALIAEQAADDDAPPAFTPDGDQESILDALGDATRTEARLRQLCKVGKPDGMPAPVFAAALKGLRDGGLVLKHNGKLSRS